jgi:post-segregation antitoxin (ccd killing protein)
MFERFTERARRTIFFARYEASQLGSPTIESEHLLLGILREDPALFFETDGSFRPQDLKKVISAHLKVGPSISTSVDLPLSFECKRAIAQAAEEADRLGSRHVGCEHILMGLLRQDESNVARAMKEAGMKLSAVRTVAAKSGSIAGSAATDAIIAALDRVFKLMEFMWNQQNLEGFARLFETSAEFVDVNGALWADPMHIAEATHAFDRLGNDLIAIKLSEHPLLFAGDGFCVSRVMWEVQLRQSERRIGNVIMTATLKRVSEDWKIVAAQNTRVEN